MGELLTPTHLLVIAAVALVLFGGKKLPEPGKGLGEGFVDSGTGSGVLPERPTIRARWFLLLPESAKSRRLVPVEEPNSQALFQLLHLYGHRRLRNMEIMGGAREIASLCDLQEGSNMTEILNHRRVRLYPSFLCNLQMEEDTSIPCFVPEGRQRSTTAHVVRMQTK